MTTANKARLLHALALLGSLATAVLPAWVDPQQTWPARIALTIVTGLLLAVSTQKLKSQRNAILGGLAVAGAVVAAILGKFTAGTGAAAFVGALLAVISQVRAILARELADTTPSGAVLRGGQSADLQSEQPAKGADSMNKIISVLVLFAALGATSAARADALVLPMSDTVSCSPVGMLTGFQYNASTKEFQKGVALGAGVGCRWTGWKVPLGLNLVGGAGINENAPNAAQGSLIGTVADNYGLGFGGQVVKDAVSGDRQLQFLVSFFLGASWAATMDQLHTAKVEAVKADRAGKLTTRGF